MEDDPEERRAEGLDSPDAANIILKALVALEEKGIICALDEIQGRWIN